MRIGVGLSIPELSTRGGRFSPASLFTSGAKGAWYDPSDYSSLFQDSVGTTPVTAVEQPVGLMLDKSQGLVLGSELVVNGNFSDGSTGWTITGTGWSIGSGIATHTGTVSGDLTQASLTVGRTYKITATITGTGATVYLGDSTNLGQQTGSFSAIATCAGSTTLRFRCPHDAVTIDNISVKELPGNHASQATPTSCPILRARYNLLTYSEQFDNAGWFAGSTTVSANQATAPDLTVTADLVYPTSSGTSRYIWRTASVFTASAQVITSSFYIKASSWTWVMVNGTGTNTGVWFNISTGQKGTESSGYTGTITDAGSGWWRVTVTETRTGAVQPTVFLADANSSITATASGTNGIYIWGADLRTGSSAGTYQRIAAATDYATAGFLPYLALVTDDSMATGSIDFTATDKMFVCAGVTKNSDAAVALLAELSATMSSNNGTFFIAAPNGLSANYGFASKGTSQATANSASTYAAPTTNVISGIGDISGAITRLRVNTVATTDTTSQGTGNYGNYPLYIGRRGGLTIPLNGNIYQFIVVGKALSASELASTESYVATKTGVTL